MPIIINENQQISTPAIGSMMYCKEGIQIYTKQGWQYIINYQADFIDENTMPIDLVYETLKSFDRPKSRFEDLEID